MCLGDALDLVGDAVGGIGDAVGGAFDFLKDAGLDKVLATVGTVVPGPWTPFAVGYNVLDNAAQGNWLGAGLSAFGGANAFSQGLGQLGQSMGLSDIAAAAGDVGGSAGGFADAIGGATSAPMSIPGNMGGSGFLDAIGQGADTTGGLFGPMSSNQSLLGSLSPTEALATGAGGLGGMFQSAMDYAKANPGVIKGGLKVGGSVLDAIGAKQAQSAVRNNINQLNDMYSAQSPYAEEMRKQLARKDAARGRRSQYGTREVQLANSLTQQKANIMNNPYYLQQLGASSNSTLPYGNIARGLASLF